ncbi:MAG: hypothetical protein MJE12_20800, partial [Alphaproteobacteria bacterium]|nr:hypothetical protein [Alphaproteobacteria bacterium]
MAFLGLSLIASDGLIAATPDRSTGEVLKAIVRIDANIPAEARTAQSLGTTRIGSGVLIDAKGLV